MSAIRHYRSFCLAAGTFLFLLMLAPLASAAPTATSGAAEAPITYPTFADPAFQKVWERYDRPVWYGQTSRSYTWGAQQTAGLQEQYNQGPNSQHMVQYFDKSRMEINNPAGNPNDAFFVTQGLLAEDMIYGRIQVGDTDFTPAKPAEIPFGDLDDTAASSPTYASFHNLINEPPIPAGNAIAAALDRNGNVANSADPRGVTSAGVLPGTTTNHSIASVFANFLVSAGPVYDAATNQNVNASIYNPIFYVTGMPITEAYWAKVKAAGTYTDVLIQCFERRCLTYIPAYDPAFQVQLANTGLEYYAWRYPQVYDKTPPALTNLTITNVTATSVTIGWATDEPATTEVRYGTTGQYESLAGDLKLVTAHSITLTGLLSNQNYHFVISSVDAAGNRATSADQAFKTEPAGAAPTVSAITVATTTTTATLTFTTNPATVVQVAYHVTGDSSVTTNFTESGSATTTHSITLNGLAPGTSYTYRVIALSNTGQTTTDAATFTTASTETTSSSSTTTETATTATETTTTGTTTTETTTTTTTTTTP
jgi:hypothetical protein